MPTMKEIYQHHAAAYDELVDHEDYEQNLQKFLQQRFHFAGKTVIELGAGTGRVTSLYIEEAAKVICCDGSLHMLEKGKKNLERYSGKIDFRQCDNLAMVEIKEKASFVIEGWSFGHTVIDHFEDVEQVVGRLVKGCSDLLLEDGTMLFIETMGSNREEAGAPREELARFYEILEKDYQFQHAIIRTDYRFATVAEAVRIFSFFFGEHHSQGIAEKESPIITEYTGLWFREKLL